MRRTGRVLTAGLATAFLALALVAAVREDTCLLIGLGVLLGPPLLQVCLSLALRRFRPRSSAQRAAARRRLGLCVRCGYDLRASVGRCPECGTPIPS